MNVDVGVKVVVTVLPPVVAVVVTVTVSVTSLSNVPLDTVSRDIVKLEYGLSVVDADT